MATKTNSRTRSASSASSSPPPKRQKITGTPFAATTVAPFAATFPRRTLLSSSRWVNKVPHDIWVYKIFQPFLDLKALSTLGRCNTFFEEYWKYVLKQNIIRVPEGCPTVNQALELAVVFSERNECTRENPVQVQVGEGNHEMRTCVDVLAHTTYHIPVDCNNVTIVGKGKGKTTILGGFGVNGKQNVKIQQLSARNIAGHGLDCRNGATVDVTECCFKLCRDDGMCVDDGATVTATRCDFMKNYECGMFVDGGATVTATRCDFMENGGNGVLCSGANTKVRLNGSTMHHNGEYGLQAYGEGYGDWSRAMLLKVRLNDSTMHHNGESGLQAYGHAVVNLHGTKTDIHSNKWDGIYAYHNAKVNIHLPSQHNTTHDNVRENRFQFGGGSIANINADGTFTHVEEVHDDEEDDD
jgi:hypothetical protein